MLSIVQKIVNKQLQRYASTLVTRRYESGGISVPQIKTSSTIYALSSGWFLFIYLLIITLFN